MDVQTAMAPIEGAVTPGAATWADLGAGSGTFTLALERVVVLHRADFLKSRNLPPLDGLLLANALHFVPTAEQPETLRHLAAQLWPGGRLLVVEYGRTRRGCVGSIPSH